MKTLIIGCGGIGSNLVSEIMDLYYKQQIPPEIDFVLADEDMVEMNQIQYQKFLVEDVGRIKSEVLGERHSFEYIAERITKNAQLKGYEMIVLCVDNEPTRELVVRYCWKNKVEFIDLRASGSRVFAMPKGLNLKENLKFIDGTDKREYSCQNAKDLEKGWIQLGNRLIAVRGAQMLLNHIRGHTNRVYMETI